MMKGLTSVFRRPGSDLLFRVLKRSTIGAGAFNGRVRDGIGFRHSAIATRPAKNRRRTIYQIKSSLKERCPQGMFPKSCRLFGQEHDPDQWASTNEKIKPVERLVPISFTHYCASTLGLSTRSSSSVLKGEIVLRWVSRLDAFSGYPVHT